MATYPEDGQPVVGIIGDNEVLPVLCDVGDTNNVQGLDNLHEYQNKHNNNDCDDDQCNQGIGVNVINAPGRKAEATAEIPNLCSSVQ